MGERDIKRAKVKERKRERGEGERRERERGGRERGKREREREKERENLKKKEIQHLDCSAVVKVFNWSRKKEMRVKKQEIKVC